MQINVLCSRYYLNKDFRRLLDFLADLGCLGQVYLDSGAFSDWNKGRAADVLEYCAWLDDLVVRHDRCVLLNVIGDNRQTLANLTYMMAQGYRPIPVWQPGMSVSDVSYLYECADFGGGGGVVAIGGDPKRGWTAEFQRALAWDWPADRRHDIHLLGVTDTRLIGRWRPLSADTSSWSSGLRFGHLKGYVPGEYRLSGKVKRGGPVNDEARAFLELIGVDAGSLDAASWKQTRGVSKAGLVTLAAHIWFAEEVQVAFNSRMFLSFGSALYKLLTADFDVLGRVNAARRAYA